MLDGGTTTVLRIMQLWEVAMSTTTTVRILGRGMGGSGLPRNCRLGLQQRRRVDTRRQRPESVATASREPRRAERIRGGGRCVADHQRRLQSERQSLGGYAGGVFVSLWQIG